MTTNSEIDFSHDRPLTSRQDDRLNRGAFTDRIASILQGLPNGTSLVVGIYGPWGDGKTTVLNLLCDEISKNNTIIVRDFNPWRLTDDEAMFRSFVTLLAEAIGASLTTKLENAKIKAGKWAKFGRWGTRILGPFSTTAKTVDDLLSRLEDVARHGNSCGLEELRARIFEKLSLSSKRIAILIDDIDRLDKHETHTLFRLIKACADFPNVCYVLAFDDSAVAKALGERFAGGDETSGRAFLEKIVQVPLKLPVAAKEDLRLFCFEQVDKALAASGVELTKDQFMEFISDFDRGVSIRLTTPRAAIRFGNCLLFALPILIGETNPVDLLLIEALRAFFPEVYDIVRDNYEEFTGIGKENYGRSTDSHRSADLLDPILKAMPNEQASSVKDLLTNLFPRLHGVYGNMHYGQESLERWTRERRISSPDYCQRYFLYAIPLNDIADSEISELIRVAILQRELETVAWLTTHLSGPKVKRVIEKLRALEKSIEPKAAKVIAISIAKLGELIPNTISMFSFTGPSSQAAILVSHLLRRISNRDERMEAAKLTIEVADPLWFGAECVRWLYVTDKPEKEDSNTLNELETKIVRQILVERIKIYAESGAPLFDPDLPSVSSLLFEWRRDEGRNPVQAHLLHVFSKDTKQIARFLLAMTPLSWPMSGGPPHVSDFDADQLNSVERLIDLDIMAELVRNNCSGNFDNPVYHHDGDVPVEQRLAEQYMLAYSVRKKNLETLPEPSNAKA